MNDALPQDLTRARAMMLHASAQALLYDVQRRVQRGYVWWVRGEVPASKLLAVVTKLHAKYDVFASPSARSRRRAAGGTSCVLFVWPVRADPEGYTTCFRFLLLATSPLEAEKMDDARQRPVRADLYLNNGGQFHLRPVLKQRGGETKAVYAWHLIPKAQDLMTERLVAAAAAEWPALQQTLDSYKCLPMTSGYRQQLKAALQQAAPAWRRNNRPSVLARKQLVRTGGAVDLFRAPLPFVAGFQKLYDDPPLTLKQYLAANDKRRKQLAQQRLERVERDHAGV